MDRFIAAWANFVLARRAAIVAAVVALIPLLLLTGGPLPFDNSTERYFIAGDPTLAEYDRLLDLFGDNEYLLVGIEATGTNDVFTTPALHALQEISDFLEFHPAITQLRSLTNFQYVHADGDDLRTDYLIDDIATLGSDPAAIAQVKSILDNEPLAIDTLITPDFRNTRVAARVEYRGETSAHKIDLVQDLFSFIETESLFADADEPYRLHLSGYPLVNERFETVSAEDSALLIPIMTVLMIAILYFSFRSWAATLFPWLVIGGGLLMLLELQYYLGIPQTTIDSAALAPTLIIIGIGITVHVLLEFFHYSQNTSDSVEAARSTILTIWKPAFFTAITTSAGFLALSVTRILPIREFALLGAIGPILLFLLALTLLPAMLSYLKTLPASTSAVIRGGLITRAVANLPGIVQTHSNKILVAGALLLLFIIWNLPRAEIENNYVTLFKEDSQTRQDIEYFDDVFKGMMTLDIILDSGSPEGIKEPEFLTKMATIQDWLSSHEDLGKINSLVDYLHEINMALHGDDPAFRDIPISRELTAQYLLLYDSSGANEDLSDLKDFDNRYTRMVVPVINLPASAMQTELDVINEYLTTNYSELNPVTTGTMVLYTVQDIYTADGMLKSFLTALFVICLFFIILFRSVRYGLLSIIPSVLPILLAASFAGWLGIYLDQSSVIVFAMTMGIAVDDAIHVMNRYLINKRQGEDVHTAVQRAMFESGRAVVFSSLTLVAGFSVLTLGSFTTTIHVGMFGAIIMAMALIGDLVFLPAILYLVDRQRPSNNNEQSLTG
ncbi:MAG: MMPL family transporter [Gammaproteobacteria bacterium]